LRDGFNYIGRSSDRGRIRGRTRDEKKLECSRWTIIPFCAREIAAVIDGEDDIELVAEATTGEEAIKPIRAVNDGQRCVPPEIAAELADHMTEDALTDREVAVLRKVAMGSSNKIIASKLNLSEATVKGHMKSVLSKLGANDRTPRRHHRPQAWLHRQLTQRAQQVLGAPFKPHFGLSGIMALDEPLPAGYARLRKIKISARGDWVRNCTATLVLTNLRLYP
jgi:DNA-binding CsgD family transcriptional regulator